MNTSSAQAPDTLLLNAQRILVGAQSDLLDLAEEVGKGARRGLENETVMLMLVVSQKISNAMDLLIHKSERGNECTPLQ